MKLRGLQKWLDHGDRGVSSEAIVRHLVESGNDHQFLRPHDESHPRDLDDFERCRALLAAVPALRRRLHRMREVSPQWGALVICWGSISATIDRGRPDDAYRLLSTAIGFGDSMAQTPPTAKRKARRRRGGRR